MLACAQLGITVCSLGLGAVAEPAIAGLLRGPFGAAHLPHGLVHPLAFAIGLALVVYLHVVLGEVVPKNLALAGPDRVALLLAPPLVWCARAVGPLAKGLNAVAKSVVRLLRVEPKDEVTSTFTADEVASILAESRREGLIDDRQGLVTGALAFAGRDAGEVAVPLAELVILPLAATPAVLERAVAQTGYSRFPVSDRPDGATSAGQLVGYLHLKDVLGAKDRERDEPVPRRRLRDLATVGAGDDAEDVVAVMQRTGAHLARVVDAQDLVIGVVFLEDMLEQLVGEVRDASRRTP
ncbi:MAG: hemolysin family protein, partial [Actinomycetota bacterium]|nr:hemolysin family protein [Actinomycetota bacterium]